MLSSLLSFESHSFPQGRLSPFTEKKESVYCNAKKAGYGLGIGAEEEIKRGETADSFGGWKLLDCTVLVYSEIQYYYYYLDFHF